MPVFVLHGSLDLAVPHRTARDTARRTDGVLVTIERAGHSWMLRDPETLPAIVAELLATELGESIRRSLAGRRGPGEVPDHRRRRVGLLRADARVFALAPADPHKVVVGRHRRPKYRWHTER